MRRRISSKLFLFCFVFILATDISHAAGIIMRIQQKKRMSQQQAQGMTEEQYQQSQQSQGQGAAGPQAPPPPPTYQQTVDQRNQAIAQAILNAHNQAVSTETVPFGNNAEFNQVAQPAVSTTAAPQQQALPQAGSKDAKDVVDLSEVWKKLDTKSTVWTLLIDDQSKVLTVSEYIDRFRQEGVKINVPPEQYVKMIDQVADQNPQLLQRPFGELLQIMAVINYDFDNGMSKDDLARKVLGEAGYEENKKRFTQ